MAPSWFDQNIIDSNIRHKTHNYFSEVVEEKKEKIINKRMEALVSTLASHSTLSPGSVRTLIRRTMDTEVRTARFSLV